MFNRSLFLLAFFQAVSSIFSKTQHMKRRCCSLEQFKPFLKHKDPFKASWMKQQRWHSGLQRWLTTGLPADRLVSGSTNPATECLAWIQISGIQRENMECSHTRRNVNPTDGSFHFFPSSPNPLHSPRMGSSKYSWMSWSTLHVSASKWERLCFPSTADMENKQNTCSSRCKCMLKASQSQQGRGVTAVGGRGGLTATPSLLAREPPVPPPCKLWLASVRRLWVVERERGRDGGVQEVVQNPGTWLTGRRTRSPGRTGHEQNHN